MVLINHRYANTEFTRFMLRTNIKILIAILIKCIAMLLDTKFICLVLICLINKMKLRLIKMD